MIQRKPVCPRPRRAAVVFVWLALAVGQTSCVPIEPDPPVDQNGDPIELLDPADRWLRVVATSPSPGPVGLRPTFAFEFNDYLDDDSFRSFGFAALSSGGIRANGRAFYRMTDKTVVWRPNRSLVPGLIYTLTLSNDLHSATGAPFLQAPAGQLPPSARRYIPTDDGSNETPSYDLPDVSWAAVEPIIEARCASCHADPQWGLNPLSFESLVGARSAQTDLYLVRPGDPADSYLMRKLLWDYPDIEFVPQPPPWSPGAEELPREELLLFEGWIAHGARL
jgi:hypothetical protein